MVSVAIGDLWHHTIRDQMEWTNRYVTLKSRIVIGCRPHKKDYGHTHTHIYIYKYIYIYDHTHARAHTHTHTQFLVPVWCGQYGSGWVEAMPVQDQSASYLIRALSTQFIRAMVTRGYFSRIMDRDLEANAGFCLFFHFLELCPVVFCTVGSCLGFFYHVRFCLDTIGA